MPKSKNRRKKKKVEKVTEYAEPVDVEQGRPGYEGPPKLVDDNGQELPMDPLAMEILRDNRLDGPSRVLWMDSEMIRQTGGLRTTDEKGEWVTYRAAFAPGETVEHWIRRGQYLIDPHVAILWILTEKTAEHPVVSYSNEQFAEYLERKPKLIASTLDRVMALGYFARYQGEGEEVLYVRVDDPMNEVLARQFRKV